MASHTKLYMKLTGSTQGLIKGESQVAGFKDQIELDDWKWALERKADADVSEPSVFGFSKVMDRASTAMLSAMRNGEPLTAVISMEEASQQQFRLLVTLEGVLITQYDVRAQVQDAGGGVDEDWHFDYETVRFDYRATTKEGMSTATLRRPPGASKTAPDSNEQKIVELARPLSKEQLDKTWKAIEDDRSRMGSSRFNEKGVG